MLEFNNLEEMQPYYNKETNTYVFENDIEINFNLSIRSNIVARDINARDINALDINAWYIKALDINAMDFNAWDINAINIKAWDIKARDIDAMNINALDIKAWDIKAMDINARYIDYWGVCFAHKNIKCKSIHSDRENHKHFVLDGLLEVEDE